MQPKCAKFDFKSHLLIFSSLKTLHTLFSRYLKEQIKQLKEEKNMAVSALTRYKVRYIVRSQYICNTLYMYVIF